MTGPTREWVVFDDPKRKRHVYHFDVTYLTSNHLCIFGRGCQGVLSDPTPELSQGCCSYGAHFSDKKDRRKIEKLAKTLDPEIWQFAKQGQRKGIAVEDGEDDWRTRKVQGACIFLNRPDFHLGAGCALHVHAMREGVHHSTVKPEVCWQVPLRNIEEYDEDAGDGVVHHRITEFARHGWGEGGEEFAWWCTEAAEAFVGDRPVYREMEPELRLMVGDELFERLADYLDARIAASPAPVAHPATVPVELGRRRR
jgi:hypothetical protein